MGFFLLVVLFLELALFNLGWQLNGYINGSNWHMARGIDVSFMAKIFYEFINRNK